ncbi:MAG: class I SAM-dependent methyltransferase [Planctomycetota bacterium]|nr:class I SAM-dependent methyltransferase [Planctomycetota bacterium]
MTKTYTTLARAHHELYQSISDYDREFRDLTRILKRTRSRRVLEVGCGSGNLAPRFLEAGYDYVGLDQSASFLSIARRSAPEARFVRADMRKFRLAPRFDAVLITGRTFTHMTTNRDVGDALRCVRRALQSGGTLVFDNFDAATIFTNKKRRYVNESEYDGRRYRRVTSNTLLPERGWVWRWRADWTIREAGRVRRIRDVRILRAFTPDEIALHVRLAGLELVRTTRAGAVLTTIARRS